MPKQILAQQEHPLTADTKLVVSHGTWRKKDYVDVRVHWLSNPDEVAEPKWLPTKKGIRISPDLAHKLTVNIREMLGVSITEAPKNGKRPSRNGSKGPYWQRDGTHIAGPTPPRNAAGGFKVGKIAAYGIEMSGAGGTANIGKDACDPYDFKPAVFIPPWVPHVEHLTHRIAGKHHSCSQCIRNERQWREQAA